MTESKNDGGGTEPTTYSQEQLDAKISEALEKQKTDDADAATEAAGAELAKQKTEATDALIAQKAEFDATLEKLTAEDKAAYEKKLAEHTDKLAEMTSKEELATILEAHGQKVLADMVDTQTRNGLISEYQDLMKSSPIAGAPFTTDGIFDQALFDAEIPAFDGMQTAALEGMVTKAKLVVAAVPGTASFDRMTVAGHAPGTNPDAGFAADMQKLGVTSVEFS